MRGGGSWLPLFWLMVAFLIVVRVAHWALPLLTMRYRIWRSRHRHSAR